MIRNIAGENRNMPSQFSKLYLILKAPVFDAYLSHPLCSSLEAGVCGGGSHRSVFGRRRGAQSRCAKYTEVLITAQGSPKKCDGSHHSGKLARLRARAQPRVPDLFSGCGGLSLGFSATGFNITAAIENTRRRLTRATGGKPSGDVSRSEDGYGQTVTETGPGRPVFTRELQARGNDIDPVCAPPYGPAAADRPNQEAG